MHQRTKYLPYNPLPCPDVWFSIPPNKLYTYLGEIGPEGRLAYLKINAWDFFPYMPSYTILLSALLFRQCINAGWNTKISLLVPLIMMMDIVESTLLGYATQQFPSQLDPFLISLASFANQIKWMICAGVLMILMVLFVRNKLRMSGVTKPHVQ
jgi:hypothetical protein